MCSITKWLVERNILLQDFKLESLIFKKLPVFYSPHMSTNYKFCPFHTETWKASCHRLYPLVADWLQCEKLLQCSCQVHHQPIELIEQLKQLEPSRVEKMWPNELTSNLTVGLTKGLQISFYLILKNSWISSLNNTTGQ